MGIFSGIGTAVGAYFGGTKGAEWGGQLGSGIDNWLARKDQKDANQQNIDQAQKQMDFQERMSNTSYQRAVADMEKAGLNPMLAYSQGGASTPGGSMATVEAPAKLGISSAAQTSQQFLAYAQAHQAEASVEQTRALTDKIRSETIAGDINTARAVAELKNAGLMGQQMQEDVVSKRYGAMSAGQLYRAMMERKEDPDNVGPGFRLQVDKDRAAVALAWAQREAAKGSASASSAQSRLTDTQDMLQGLKLTEALKRNEFWKSSAGTYQPYLEQELDIANGVSNAVRAAKPGIQIGGRR